MTLNQIIKRIKDICTAHKQVRSFFHGRIDAFLADKGMHYAAVVLQNGSGTIGEGRIEMNFRLFFLDLVHMASDSGENETDVISDMIQVAGDIVAQLNHGAYTDWRISATAPFEILVSSTDDNSAGCVADITISSIYKQNVCAVPTQLSGYGSDAEPEITLADGQSFIINATNTGNRFRITINEITETEEGQFIITKLD